MIAYATAPDSVAADGGGPNSPYTEELLKQLYVPGVLLETMFRRVTEQVSSRTNGKQEPWFSANVKGDFYFSGSTQTTQNGATSSLSGRTEVAPSVPPTRNSSAVSIISVEEPRSKPGPTIPDSQEFLVTHFHRGFHHTGSATGRLTVSSGGLNYMEDPGKRREVEDEFAIPCGSVRSVKALGYLTLNVNGISLEIKYVFKGKQKEIHLYSALKSINEKTMANVISSSCGISNR